MKKYVILVTVNLLLLSGCNEANEEIGIISSSPSVCQSPSKFASMTRIGLLGKVKIFYATDDSNESQQKYRELISIFDEASKSVVECQVIHSKKRTEMDCNDCLVDLYMDIQGIHVYLSSNLIGGKSLLIQDLELIQIQIQE